MQYNAGPYNKLLDTSHEASATPAAKTRHGAALRRDTWGGREQLGLPTCHPSGRAAAPGWQTHSQAFSQAPSFSSARPPS